MANEKRYIFNSTSPMTTKRDRIEPFDKGILTLQSNEPLVTLGHITNTTRSTIMREIFHTKSGTTGATGKVQFLIFTSFFCSIDKISFWEEN